MSAASAPALKSVSSLPLANGIRWERGLNDGRKFPEKKPISEPKMGLTREDREMLITFLPIEELMKLLADSEDVVRLKAAQMIGKLDARECIPELIKKLSSSSNYIEAEGIIWALSELKAKEAKEIVLTAMASPFSERLRTAGLLFLGKVGAVEELPVLVKHLEDERYGVCRSAMDSIVMLDFSLLIEQLRWNRNPQVRADIAMYLSEVNILNPREDVYGILMDCLKTERDRKVVQALIEAIDEISKERMKE
ncbi:MAG: HEAT repeat domain-containing protein [Candidatus Micrarchaeota archaeon]